MIILSATQVLTQSPCSPRLEGAKVSWQSSFASGFSQSLSCVSSTQRMKKVSPGTSTGSFVVLALDPVTAARPDNFEDKL